MSEQNVFQCYERYREELNREHCAILDMRRQVREMLGNLSSSDRSEMQLFELRRMELENKCKRIERLTSALEEIEYEITTILNSGRPAN